MSYYQWYVNTCLLQRVGKFHAEVAFLWRVLKRWAKLLREKERGICSNYNASIIALLAGIAEQTMSMSKYHHFSWKKEFQTMLKKIWITKAQSSAHHMLGEVAAPNERNIALWYGQDVWNNWVDDLVWWWEIEHHPWKNFKPTPKPQIQRWCTSPGFYLNTLLMYVIILQWYLERYPPFASCSDSIKRAVVIQNSPTTARVSFCH